MEQVIVAFESEKTCRRVKEILESSGTAACLVCRSGDQVRRWVHEQHIATVICGYKLAEEPAVDVLRDLPSFCSMLLLAARNRLDLVQGDNLVLLPAPATRSALIEGVEGLLQAAREAEAAGLRRDREERALIAQAKERLRRDCAMTEEEAHRYLQKKSMERGVKLVQTARQVLEEP